MDTLAYLTIALVVLGVTSITIQMIVLYLQWRLRRPWRHDASVSLNRKYVRLFSDAVTLITLLCTILSIIVVVWLAAYFIYFRLRA